MFGFFKKKFDAQRDMTIAVTFNGKPIESDTDVPAGEPVRLVTTGLAKRKLPELELVGVPLELVRTAAGLLNVVAPYCANERAIKSGESFGSVLHGCLLAVRGFSVKVGEVDCLRLVDIEEKSAEAGLPKLALSTLAFLRGQSLVEEERESAIACWEASVAMFPGTPTREPSRVEKNGIVNDQNFLSYLALARHAEGEVEQSRWYERALERSVNLWSAEFGTVELPALAGDSVTNLLAALMEGELGTPWGPERMKADGLKGADLMSMALAPLVERTEGGFMQQLSVLPFPFRAYFYESPVREALRSPECVKLVGELYAAAQRAPARVMSLTLETRNVYLPAIGPEWLLGGDEGAGMQRPVAITGAEVPVLSRLLADVGRRLAAGLTHDELRVTYGLREDASALAEATRKMNALTGEEGRLMGLSMGIELPELEA